MAAKLSVVINAQDVEDYLSSAMASVKNLADEIVVIDQDSKDKTAEIAKKLGAKVFRHKSVKYVELARNFALAKATGDWILVLDPDEEIPTRFGKKIKEIIKNPEADYYRIPRKNIIFGKWMKYTQWWPDYQTRLFKKGHVSWNEVIHSVPMTTGKGSDLPAKEDFAIVHHNYNSIEEYIEKLNRYTSVQAKHLNADGYKFRWQDLITKPLTEFINRYFKGEGYKDGIHGLVLSFMQAFSELSVYAKVWGFIRFKEEKIGSKDVFGEMRNAEKEIHYWQHDANYKISGKIGDRLKRKLKI